MAILKIVFSVLLTAVLALFFLRGISEKSVAPSHDTELIQQIRSLKKPLHIPAFPGGDFSQFIKNQKATTPMVYWETDFSDNKWVVKGTPIAIEKATQGNPFIHIVRVPSSQPPIRLAKFVEQIKTNELYNRLLIHSYSDGVLKYIREASPRTTLGTGLATVTRLKSLVSLGIDGFIKTPNDFFVIPEKWKGASLFSKELFTALKKRKKIIFLGPFENKKMPNTLRGISPDGLVILYGEPRINH